MSEAYWLATCPDRGSLAEWIAARQDDGASWRAISNELRELTDGVVDLPQQTLINWFGDRDREPAA